MLVENKKARFDYEIVESLEAGIELLGTEVKSLRSGGSSLQGSRIVLRDGQAYLMGSLIPKYKFDSREDYDPSRLRRLLIHKKELVALGTKMKSAGLTLVPMKMYNSGSLIKVQIALVRGKKKYEKREIIKKRETEMGLARRLKTNNGRY